MISRVQSKTGNSGAVATTAITVTLDAAPTAGNILVLAIAYQASGGQFPTATIGHTSGISWLQVTGHQPTNDTTSTLFVGKVYIGASAGISISHFSGKSAVVVAEYSGVAASFDRVNTVNGASGTTLSVGAMGATESASQLWVAAFAARLNSGVTFSSPTGGFTIVGQDKSTSGTADRSCGLLECIASSVGTPNAGVTASGSGNWAAALATFTEATTAGAETVSPFLF